MDTSEIVLGDIRGTLEFAAQQPDDQTGPGASSAMSAIASCIQRTAPPGTRYAKQVDEVMADKIYTFAGEKTEALIGVLRAIEADYESGRLRNLTGLVRGDLFADFIGMSEHLAQEKFPDAAAVIAGSVLEEHVRKLAEARAISTEQGNRPVKFETLNGELRKTEPPTYSELERKQLSAWYAIRTAAAHARRDEYSPEQVNLMIEGIRGFLIRIPD